MTADPKHERRAREYASGIPGLSITYLAQQFTEIAAEARAEALEEAGEAISLSGSVHEAFDRIRALKQKETKP